MSITRLVPAFKSYLWGGTRLKEEYGKDFPGDILAESWELSTHPDGPCFTKSGESLRAYLGEELPILIKLIDAKQKLSIQVHPNNCQAKRLEKDKDACGKTECWIVLDAEPNAFLYYGLKKRVSKSCFRKHIQDGTLEELMQAVPVHRGDVFFIPAGTLHAIGEGILLAEVQQSSNLTYRVYDYNRRGADGKLRPLHIEKALRVAKLQPAKKYDFGTHLCSCKYFTTDLRRAPFEGNCDAKSFVSVLITEGEGTLQPGNIPCKKGDSFFIPAGSGAFTLEGTVQALITTK